MANFLHKLGNAIDALRGIEYHSPQIVERSLGEIHKLTSKGMSFMINGEPITFGDLSDDENIANAIQSCPPVAYILNKMGSAFCNGIIRAVNANTNNDVKGINIHYQNIIDRPNYIQNDLTFRKQIYVHVKSFGKCVVLKVKPAGAKMRNEVSSLWALPNRHIEIKEKDNVDPTQRKNIKECLDYVKFDGVELSLDDIYFFTDDTPYMDSLIIPSARLTPLKASIENLATNYQSRGRLLNMPAGFFSSGGKDSISNIALTPDEKHEAEMALESYGLGKRQRKFILMSAAVNWQTMSHPIAQMQFDVMEKLDTINIAEGLEYPPFLLGMSDKGIYNNVKEAKQALYSESIIPYSTNYCQQFTEMMQAKDDNVKYISDYSHVPAMQADQKQLAEARKAMGDAAINEYKNDVITRNRMLELLGEPLLEASIGDLYFSQTQQNDTATK